jgi:hypothetical protein
MSHFLLLEMQEYIINLVKLDVICALRYWNLEILIFVEGGKPE